jgi:hypothetical protein
MVSEEMIDNACTDIARKIVKSMEVKQHAQRILEKMQRVQTVQARKDEPMKLSPSEEAEKLLKEYAIDKARKAAADAESIHKLNAEPELRRDHYAELMKRYAAHNAAEIAKVRQPKVEHAQPDDDGPIDWSDDKAATRAYRKEQAAKASGRQGPPNAQDRFSTTSETDLNGGTPRQVSGANINPRPL